MRTAHQCLLGSLAFVALAAGGAASAADLPARQAFKAPAVAPEPTYNWGGFYVGGNAGYAWGSSDAVTTADGVGTYFANSSPPAINALGSGTIHSNGFAGGVEAGYNWQAGSWVAGVESDFGAFDLNGSRTATGVYPCCAPSTFTINQQVSTDWLFTARGRLGWVWNNVLFYGTGGVAVTDLKYTNSFSDNFAGVFFGLPAFNAAEGGSVSQTKVGWVAGGGVETALSGNWSVKAEYLYIDFGSISSTGTLTAFQGLSTAPFSHSTNLSAGIARAGVNYKF